MEDKRITQAVILSAGFGMRLASVTGNKIPKVMVPILGKPILEWHIERLRDCGIKDIYINLHFLPDVVKNYFGDGSKWGVTIDYFIERPEILGTGGGIKDFDGKLHGDFFVIYGDVFSLVDYKKMEEAYYERPGIIGMEIVGETDHPHDSDLVELDDSLKFLKIYTKPHKELPKKFKSMRTTFIFNERILKYIPKNTHNSIDHELLPEVMGKGEEVYGYECREYMKDIGTPNRYKQVEDYLRQNI